MAAPSADQPLGFYTFLKRFDHRAPDVQAALSFTRICDDLVQRAAAALAAQAGRDYTPPPFPRSAVFQAWLDGTTGELAMAWRADELTSAQPSLLGELCIWLARHYAHATPTQTSYQVWVGERGSRQLSLYGPAAADPPTGLVLTANTAPPPLEIRDSCIAFGHYDVHGLAMLALGLRTLERLGQSAATGVLNFEMTGDIGKLWKRAVPQAIRTSEAWATVAMIDCPVHSRKPEHTLKVLKLLDAHPDVQLVLIDHHPDTLHLAPQLMHPQVRLVLTDVWSCSLLYQPDPIDQQLRLLGALGDKVPEAAAASSPERDPRLYAANDAYHRSLLHYSPTPNSYKNQEAQPLEPLWLALAAGQPIETELLASKVGLTLPEAPTPTLPDSQIAGNMLFVTTRLQLRGRDWYGLLEGLMQRDGLSYSAALRVLDGNRANMLLLTHYQDTHVPPVRSFVPDEYLPRCLGHPAAVWVDLALDEALPFLRQVAANANRFAGVTADFTPIASALQANILDKPPSGPEHSEVAET